MQNASLKDQITAIMIGVVVFIFILWWVGIRPQKSKYEELVITRATLQQREAACDELKLKNGDTEKKISDVETSIVDVEKGFLPALNNDCIEQYLLKLFEDNGCPYLSSIKVEPVDCETITLPDGTASVDVLACSRVYLEYAATDGYCVPQYNYSPDLSTYSKLDEETILASVALMGTYAYNTGYEGFVTTLHVLEQLNPSCVKINKIEVLSELGYNKLFAEVDFYAINAVNRVSAGTSDLAYVNWSGETNTPVGHGIIGIPLLVTDPENAFYNAFIVDGDITKVENRPFATYYSMGMFAYIANNGGLFVPDPEADADALAAEKQVVPLVPNAQILFADSLEDIEVPAPEVTE